jgi:hypothetical protein
VCEAWFSDYAIESDLSGLYLEKYFKGDEYLNYELGSHVHHLNFQRKFSRLENLIDIKKVRILEVGAATGEFLEVAKAKGVTTLMGIEISEYAREISLKKGFDVRHPDDENLDEVIREFCPNLIVGWDVWEHLKHPSDIFEHYLSLSDKNALLAISTVDAGSINARIRGHKWRQFHPPTHINYPTKKSFKIFGIKNNLSLKEQFYFGYYRPLAEYVCAILGKRRWILNSSFLFKIPLYFNMYDTQFVIFKKEE